jgi:hypothetical protein
MFSAAEVDTVLTLSGFLELVKYGFEEKPRRVHRRRTGTGLFSS